LEAISKIGFWFKIKAEPRVNPQAYPGYVEDLERAPNAEIGPKDFFEMLLQIHLAIITICSDNSILGYPPPFFNCRANRGPNAPKTRAAAWLDSGV
jgi:hypothetical protein